MSRYSARTRISSSFRFSRGTGILIRSPVVLIVVRSTVLISFFQARTTSGGICCSIVNRPPANPNARMLWGAWSGKTPRARNRR